MFIYHGRFQPPHHKHAQIINETPGKIIVVLDDAEDPFSVNKRIAFFKNFINKEKLPYVIFKSSKHVDNKNHAVDNIYKTIKGHIYPNSTNVVVRGENDPELNNIWYEKYGIPVMSKGREKDISSTEIRYTIFSNKNLSFIINNGCKFNCPYCIWRDHSLRNQIGPNNFEKIKTFLFYLEYFDKKAILSGGGDPVEGKEFLKLVKEWNNPKLFDIHTSYVDIDSEIMNYVNKVVFHINKYSDLNSIRLKADNVNIRVSLVLTSDIDISFMRSLVGKFYDQEVSFRELVGNNQPSNKIFEEAKNLEDNFKHVKFVKQNDYNLYYMPNDKIYNNFNF